MKETDKIVVAAVIKRDAKYLVCRRPANKRHGGLWEFPGGKIETGESLFQAAVRELKEELNIHATACGELIFSIKDSASGYLISFLEIEAAGTPELMEHSESKWLAIEDLAMLDLAPSDKEFVQVLTKSAQEN